MAKSFSVLRAKMSPESRARSEKQAAYHLARLLGLPSRCAKEWILRKEGTWPK